MAGAAKLLVPGHSLLASIRYAKINFKQFKPPHYVSALHENRLAKYAQG